MARIIEQPAEGSRIALDPVRRTLVTRADLIPRCARGYSYTEEDDPYAVPKRRPVTSATVPRQQAARGERETAETLRGERGAKVAP